MAFCIICPFNIYLFIWLHRVLFIYFFFYIYFWLCWVFVSVRGLSPVAASGGHSSSRCAGLFTIAASPVVEHRLQTRRLSSCGSRAQLLRGMWDLPRPGLKPVSPALAGRLSTTAPPGKPIFFIFCSFVLSCFHHLTGFIYLFIYLFFRIYYLFIGCVGSLLLRTGFL